MFKNVFLKSLYERRWATLGWFLGVLSMTLLTVALYPVFRDSLGESLKDVPESLQALLGNANDYQSITRYVDLQVISQLVFLTTIAGIVLGTSMLAGDENSGTLHTLLAQPVTRTKVFLQKYAAMATLLAVIAFGGTFVGIGLGAIMAGESMDYGRVAAASGMTWLITMFFATLAYALGAITGKRSIGGVVAGFYAFAGFMITTLAVASKDLEKLDYLSPFHYYNKPSVLLEGLDTLNVTVFSAAIILLLVVGLIIFKRRDLVGR